MSGATGHTFLYNLIIIFILVVFGFLAGIMSYYKAFKINNRIISIIEKYEGYNSKSGAILEIYTTLESLGYSQEYPSCKGKYHGMNLYNGNTQVNRFEFCIYVDDENKKKNTHTFGVLTYMTIDFPLVDRIKIPVFSKTRSIYNFGN